MVKKGYLILDNGKTFEGVSFGEEKEVNGEVVFNTGMVGYVEGFTDPSYFGQILTLTYPLIGNYGVPSPENWESEKIQIRGLIISSYQDNNTHWQSTQTLKTWLKSEKIPALCNIDTRSLTKIIREKGVMKGAITFDRSRRKSGLIFFDINRENLVPYVSCQDQTVYGKGKIRLLLLDCGLKLNQIRLLLKHDLTVIRVPWNYNPFAQDKLRFDALMISNGPGNPKMAKETISTVKEGLERKIPVLGICLGNQIMALAAGADTYKLKYGHRSQNQPVKDEITEKCFVTTQNHGFAVETKSLPSGWQPWFTNLNDNTNEGIRHKNLPFFSIQFHPEASPGPTDTEWIFEYYIAEIKKWLKKN